MKHLKAIAAMAQNRVIGRDNTIPWHLPEDFRWFKSVTLGHVLVMGSRTFRSIGRPLPGRTTIVLSRSGFVHPGVQTARSLEELVRGSDPRDLFVCGGADVYRQALPYCSDLYLTVLRRPVEGDTLFPPFEEMFRLVGMIRETPEFEIRHYANLSARALGSAGDTSE
jgi:dihydrofolate reductase